jgi:hypothetical protein
MLSSRDPQLAEVFESPPWQSELFRRQQRIDGCGQSLPKRGHRLREQLVAGARRHAGTAGLRAWQGARRGCGARRDAGAARRAAGLPGTAAGPPGTAAGTAGRGHGEAGRAPREPCIRLRVGLSSREPLCAAGGCGILVITWMHSDRSERMDVPPSLMPEPVTP